MAELGDEKQRERGKGKGNAAKIWRKMEGLKMKVKRHGRVCVF